jgi:hypothetical protein
MGVLGVVVGVGFLTRVNNSDDLMDLIGFIAAPAMIISSLALTALGLLLVTLGIRTFHSEHPATRVAFTTAAVVAIVTVVGAFSTPEGFGTRSSLAWLGVGLLHLDGVLFLLVARRTEKASRAGAPERRPLRVARMEPKG